MSTDEGRPNAPDGPPQARWTVWRQDDNGGRFVVQSGLNRTDAGRLVAEFEARGHKQLYWIEKEPEPPCGKQ